jgi:hypothetical protein
MAIVTTLTEDEVKQYMEDVIGDTSAKLGWTKAGGDFDEPTNEVLYTLGQSGFTYVNTQAEVKQVRTTARMEVWRHAMYYTVHEVAHSAGAPGTGQVSRADIHRHCRDQFNLAKARFVEDYPELSPSVSRQVEKFQLDYDYDYYGNAEDQ